MVVDDLVPWAIVAACEVRLRDGEADGIREPLPEGAGRRFDTGREVMLGVPGRDAAPLPETPQVVEREVVAGEEEEGVEQHGAVAGREDEAVPVCPARTGGGMLQVARPEGVGHRRGTHREAWMTGIRLLHRVSGEKTDGVDRHLLQLRLPHLLLSGRLRRPANPPRTVVRCASTLRQERISSACSHAGLRVRNRPGCEALRCSWNPGNGCSSRPASIRWPSRERRGWRSASLWSSSSSFVTTTCRRRRRRRSRSWASWLRSRQRCRLSAGGLNRRWC